MKRKIKSILKKFGIQSFDYKTERSDMGVQSYHIGFEYDNKFRRFTDGYFIGSGIGGEYILTEFNKFLTLLKENKHDNYNKLSNL